MGRYVAPEIHTLYDRYYLKTEISNRTLMEIKELYCQHFFTKIWIILFLHLIADMNEMSYVNRDCRDSFHLLQVWSDII